MTTLVLNDLDDELFDAVETQNNDELLELLQRGANPNAVCGIIKMPALLHASKMDKSNRASLAVRCTYRGS
jgi:hypothetical protein